MKNSRIIETEYSDDSSQVRPATGAVGIVSASNAGLQELASLLARENVKVSKAIRVEEQDMVSLTGKSEMLAGLQACQRDPDTEIVILLSQKPSLDAAQRVLAQVRKSEKPTVVCFLGIDQRLLWRAGAIPATRLDEAALRAAAWVRGWDQALISSQLEDLDEQLETQAQELRTHLDPSRRWIRGLFTSTIFCQEAQLMLAGIAAQATEPSQVELSVQKSSADKIENLQDALGDPQTAVILLDIVLGQDPLPDPASTLAAALQQAQDRPVAVAYVSSSAEALQQRADQEATLREAGVIVAPSNAAAAHISGLIAMR